MPRTGLARYAGGVARYAGGLSKCCCSACASQTASLTFSGIDASPCPCAVFPGGAEFSRQDPVELNADGSYQIGTGAGWQGSFDITDAAVIEWYIDEDLDCADPDTLFETGRCERVLLGLIVDCVKELIEEISFQITGADCFEIFGTFNSGLFFYDRSTHGGSYWIGDSVPNGLQCPPGNSALASGGTAIWTGA